MNIPENGPYSPTQTPCECGHYYPDVLRLLDIVDKDNKYFRLVECAFCGILSYSINPRYVGKPLKERIDKNTMNELRVKEKIRILSKNVVDKE